jgi:hypothetical protein
MVREGKQMSSKEKSQDEGMRQIVLFPPGELVMTPAALSALKEAGDGGQRKTAENRLASIEVGKGNPPGCLPYTDLRRLADIDEDRSWVLGADPMVIGFEYLIRHLSGDWGEVDAEDWETNDQSVKEGLRILSAYTLGTGVKIWIITEWNRSVTTILLPDDY